MANNALLLLLLLRHIFLFMMGAHTAAGKSPAAVWCYKMNI